MALGDDSEERAHGWEACADDAHAILYYGPDSGVDVVPCKVLARSSGLLVALQVGSIFANLRKVTVR